ncbi:MAG: EamA family transporter [Rhodospirillaceae bacterium]|jgi:O-acetylserine/cysteine efflux transporter|nr:EamA family transporter [Rhodospirillaceae bacterium]MBT5660219.1 EamA family transporter [Rhodospirillaceae bacterium]MBT5751461.1 EamA family transporter [Rhodospirillaceae bacterium]
MKPSDILLSLFVMFLWGTNFVAVKTAVGVVPPLMLMGLRFTLVAALLLPFVRPPTGYMRPVLMLSITLGLFHFGLLAIGLSGADATTAAIAIQLQVPFATILAAIILHERPGRTVIAGIIIAFGGVVLVAGKVDLSGNLFYLGLVILAALGWAISNFQLKKLNRLNVFTLNAWVSLFAVPQLFLASFLFENGQFAAVGRADPVIWAAFAYVVLVMILGHGLWYGIIGRNQISIAVPFTLLAPVIGVASGVIVLGEPLSWLMIAGGLLTLGGVAIVILAPFKKTDSNP